MEVEGGEGRLHFSVHPAAVSFNNELALRYGGICRVYLIASREIKRCWQTPGIICPGEYWIRASFSARRTPLGLIIQINAASAGSNRLEAARLFSEITNFPG